MGTAKKPKKINLPELPYDDWGNTRMTIHLVMQIMGKIRLKLTPRKNHWWNITLYVNPRGFTTSPIPVDNGMRSFEIILDVHQSKVIVEFSDGTGSEIRLHDKLTVASFYDCINEILNEKNIYPKVVNRAFDLPIKKKFSEITEYHHFDKDYINRFWTAMQWTDCVFKEFAGRFYGKTCPSHIYWHHMDLTITRFSGKKLPPMDPAASALEKDAYSHEVISFGFWAGDNNIREPAYYAYAYPSPEGLDKTEIQPSHAGWVDANGSPMAILKYHELIKEEEPRKVLLEFLESVYQSAAELANWPKDDLEVPPLDAL